MTPTRITDSRNTSDMANDGKTMVNVCVPEYSTVTPWSLNDKWLLLVHNSYFALHDGATGKFLRPLKASNANEWIASRSQPRWARTMSDVFYFLSGNSLKLFNVAAMTSQPIKQFPEYSKIDGMGEGDMLSDDGKLMALCGTRITDGLEEVFTLSMATLTKSTVALLPKVESLYLTPKSNNVLVGYHPLGTGRFQGVELFDSQMRFIRQILNAQNPHKDVALNAAGEEILIHGNGAAVIVATNLIPDAKPIHIQPFPLFKSVSGLAEHISCPVGRDFFFMDRYDPKGMMEGDIIKVWLNGTYETLAYHKSKPFPGNTYTYQPKVSCNRGGTKLIFGSNMGIGTPQNYSDVYLLNLAGEAVKPVPSPANVFTFDLAKYNAEINGGILTVRAA